MIRMKLSELARLTDGALHGGDAPFQGISIDTRRLEPGNLFVALTGERVDGHDFLDAAGRAGAAAALVARDVECSFPFVRVADPARALGQAAAAWRARLGPAVVAVTGSNGKTTVKEMLAAILAPVAPVLSTRGNYNNELGLPLTLARLNAEHRYAVLELGAARKGDIDHLCRLARPDVGVVTNAGPAHLEGFGSLEGVARGKGEMFQALPENGIAVINRDDAFFETWKAMAGRRRVITFGFHPDSDLRGAQGRQGFEIHHAGEVMHVDLVVPGWHNRLNALAAAACATALDINPEAIVAGLESLGSLPGRLEQRRAPGGWRVIDDTYNANPASLQAGLAVLAEENGERWLILGDMAELGADSESLHRQMGRAAVKAGVHRLLAVGPRAALSAEAFGSGGQAFESHEALADWLTEHAHGRMCCLVKGSRSAGMERVVENLMKEQAA